MLIFVSGVFLGQEAAQGQVYQQMEGFVGADTALQLQDIIRNASLTNKGTFAAIIGGVFLIVGATTVFAEIQDSINMIWDVKAKPKKGLLKLIKTRVLSFSMIVSLGFLLLVSLAISTVLDAINSRLIAYFPDVTVVVFYILNMVITIVVITTIFAVIYKVLPDGKIRWKDIWRGAVFTAILFILGKLGISLYISKANIGSTYGAAGSLVILLLWVYYSTIILYIGAAFTKSYAVRYGRGIKPAKYAVEVKTIAIEKDP
jgi:membrane protein